MSVGREVNKLTAIEVRTLSKSGRHGDGNGLYLEIEQDGTKRWLLRFQLHGRRRDMGLGNLSKENGLAEARQAAKDAHALIAKGTDPIEARRRPGGIPEFADQAKKLMDALEPSWRGRKTRQGWDRSLLVQAKTLARRPVDQIAVGDVLAVVKPYWTKLPESGAKLRERIERVLDSARAEGHIIGPWENPARWKGHLEHMLPKRRKLTRGHHPAMPHKDVGAFVAAISTQDSMGARAIEFTILTACRETMAIEATWAEIKGDVWEIPAARMKTAKPFRVPLSAAARAVLERVAGAGRKGWIFPGQRQRGSAEPHISNRTMDAVLHRMKLPYTPHGFRSSFRDWAGDCTTYPRDLIEEALAHQVGDAVERAYRRSDALEKRRQLMEDWAAYLAKPPAHGQPDAE